MTIFSKENVIVLPELVYVLTRKCNFVQQNAFSIRQNIEILPKNKRFIKENIFRNPIPTKNM
jgi:hypothetical protein